MLKTLCYKKQNKKLYEALLQHRLFIILNYKNIAFEGVWEEKLILIQRLDFNEKVLIEQSASCTTKLLSK